MVQGTDPVIQRRDMINGPVYGTDDLASPITLKVIAIHMVDGALGKTSTIDPVHIYTKESKVVCPMRLQTSGGTKIDVDIVVETPDMKDTPSIYHDDTFVEGIDSERLLAIERYVWENFRTFLALNNPYQNQGVDPASVRIDYTNARFTNGISIGAAPNDGTKFMITITEPDTSSWSVICRRLFELHDPPTQPHIEP